jgi:phage terminase small subunit
MWQKRHFYPFSRRLIHPAKLGLGFQRDDQLPLTLCFTWINWQITRKLLIYLQPGGVMQTAGQAILIDTAGPSNPQLASLRPKQRRFIDEYLIDMNGTAAAVRAGYSAKCARSIATENLSKPALQAALRLRQGEEANRLKITRQMAIQGILEGIGMARAMGRPDVMIRGWADLARMLGLYAPERHTVGVRADAGAGKPRFEAMSDADLAALASGGE